MPFYIDCVGDNKCWNQAKNCLSTEDCTIECSGKEACATSIINCPPNHMCNITCTGPGDEACARSIINATLSTELYVLGCNGVKGAKWTCENIDIYCPPHQFGEPKCHISGNNDGLDNCEDTCGSLEDPGLYGLHFFAINGWLDIDFSRYHGTKYTEADDGGPGEMHCFNDYIESCDIGIGWKCSGNTHCDITLNPTSNPTATPSTDTPTTTYPTTTNPTSNPTSIPTTIPTPIPTSIPTSIPTPNLTSNPTSIPTTNPTSLSTSNPTPNPTTNPTPNPTTIPTTIPTSNPTLLSTLISKSVTRTISDPGLELTVHISPKHNITTTTSDDIIDSNYNKHWNNNNNNFTVPSWMIVTMCLIMVIICVLCCIIISKYKKENQSRNKYNNDKQHINNNMMTKGIQFEYKKPKRQNIKKKLARIDTLSMDDNSIDRHLKHVNHNNHDNLYVDDNNVIAEGNQHHVPNQNIMNNEKEFMLNEDDGDGDADETAEGDTDNDEDILEGVWTVGGENFNEGCNNNDNS